MQWTVMGGQAIDNMFEKCVPYLGHPEKGDYE
jgi:hypothetical protein